MSRCKSTIHFSSFVETAGLSFRLKWSSGSDLLDQNILHWKIDGLFWLDQRIKTFLSREGLCCRQWICGLSDLSCDMKTPHVSQTTREHRFNSSQPDFSFLCFVSSPSCVETLHQSVIFVKFFSFNLHETTENFPSSTATQTLPKPAESSQTHHYEA